MIRNLDYWQPANIVIVNNNNNNNNNNRSAPPNATATAIVNCNNINNNNNEDGFGDKNGSGPRQSTVIVKMAHDTGERIDGLMIEQEDDDDDDDLIEEDLVIEEAEEEEEEVVVEEEEEEPEPAAETKALDASLTEDELEIEVMAAEPVTPTRRAPAKKSRKTPNNNNNSSFEEQQQQQQAAMVMAVAASTPSPDHHARRPMNAFLIFCKKHRPIVREKYPNLENRAITKILGDWWANLEKKDQEPFKSLASDYKDAFLSANPTFKWYKLPAPPLRTLSTRPTNSDRSYGDLLANGGSTATATATATRPAVITSRPEYGVEEGEAMVASAEPVVHQYHHHHRRRTGKNNMQLFKLADVTQMGGLSNLMSGGFHDDNNNNSGGSLHHSQSLSDKEEEQHHHLVDQSEEPFANMRTHAARMEVTPKRKLDVNSEFLAMKRAKLRADHFESAVAASSSSSSSATSPVVVATTSQKSSRACKGKKYLEFIRQGKATTTAIVTPVVVKGEGVAQDDAQSVIKRVVPQSMQQQQQAIVQPVGFPHNGYCKPQPVVPAVTVEKGERVVDNEEEGDISEAAPPVNGGSVVVVAAESEQNNGKLFDASDFELDSKITALPALSLDTYLTRKRETKKKKKIGGKGKGHHAKKQGNSSNSSATIHEVKEALQKVGSQKRKARKESITRRDVNTVAEEVLAQQGGGGDDETAGNTSDLLILATLAAGEIGTQQ